MFQWDHKYDIGHERIDFEHRIFLGLILEFKEGMNGAVPQERLSRTLAELLKYAEFHFLSEENIMQDCGYPELKAHAELHRALISRLRLYITDFLKGRMTAPEVCDMLLDWFALHTTQDDKRIAEYLHQKGLPAVP